MTAGTAAAGVGSVLSTFQLSVCKVEVVMCGNQYTAIAVVQPGMCTSPFSLPYLASQRQHSTAFKYTSFSSFTLLRHFTFSLSTITTIAPIRNVQHGIHSKPLH